MNERKTVNPAALELLEYMESSDIPSCFSRVDAMKPCPIGRCGNCCAFCHMGPCRMVGKNAEEMVGICGASAATIAARKLGRMIAAGSAAHSDHGRDLAFTLLETAKGEVKGFEIKDVPKLHKVAALLGVKTEGRSKEEIAADVATIAIGEFGQQSGELRFIKRAPKKRQEIWRRLGIVPRGIDREVVEMMHRTHVGTDQDPESILKHGLRCALSDGWGGAMLATDISDILFGTPQPNVSRVNLGVLKQDEVNIVIHGHEPSLSEMIVTAADDPEVVAYARSKGAKGVNVSGICCTSNEVLMRHGVPPAGSFLEQELAVATGVVEAMVVDVQCIMAGLTTVADRFHTKLITTSTKARISGATHIQFDEREAYPIAKLILRTAIDNFENRKETRVPQHMSNMVAGFSHEYISYMLGGLYRNSFRPLNDNIINGRIKGVVGIVGCNNARVAGDASIIRIARELIKNDVLVVSTGCAAISEAKHGLLAPETMEYAGPGLREVCEAVGMPPILHAGSCVDNSRILTALSHMVIEGGLGDDISDLPVVGLCPEWMSEKAISIGTYFVASGVHTIFGLDSPVIGSATTTRLIDEGWQKMVGGKLEFESDPDVTIQKTLDSIEAKRKALKLGTYSPAGYSRDYLTPQQRAQGRTMDMGCEGVVPTPHH